MFESDWLRRGFEDLLTWLADTVFGWFFNSSSEAIVNILNTIANPKPINISLARFTDAYNSNWGSGMLIATAAGAVLLVIMIVLSAQGPSKMIKRGGRALGFAKVWLVGVFAYPIIDLFIDGRNAIISGVIDSNLPALQNATENQQAFAAMFGVNDWIGAIVVTVLGKPLLWMLQFSELSLTWMITAITLFMAISILGGVFEIMWRAFQALFWTFFLAPFVVAVTLGVGVAMQLLTVPVNVGFGAVDGADSFLGVLAIMLSFLFVIGMFFAFFQTKAFNMGSLNSSLMVTPSSIAATGGDSSLSSGTRKLGRQTKTVAKGAGSSAMKHARSTVSRQFSDDDVSSNSIANRGPSSDDARSSSSATTKKPTTESTHDVGKSVAASGHPVAGAALMAGSVATVGAKKATHAVSKSIDEAIANLDAQKEVS